MAAFLAKAVSNAAIMAMLYQLEPMSPHVPRYGEVARAIEKASNQDPLFPHHEAGSQATAAILVALAWHETRFHPNLVGDNGKSFGLFQIQPPTAKLTANILLQPLTAAFIAIDLIRTSFAHCHDRPWTERLSWYIASGNGCRDPHPVVVKKSMSRLMMAENLFRKHFPQQKLPAGLPPKGESYTRP